MSNMHNGVRGVTDSWCDRRVRKVDVDCGFHCEWKRGDAGVDMTVMCSVWMFSDVFAVKVL